MTNTGCNNITTALTTDANVNIDHIIGLNDFTSAETPDLMKSIDVFNSYDTDKKSDISGNTYQMYFSGIKAAKTSLTTIMDSFDSTKTNT